MRVTVYRKQTTRLSLRVTPTGRVNVSAPYGCPMEQIQKFVDEHRDWIDTQLAQASQRRTKRLGFFEQLPLNNQEECKEAMRRLSATIPPIINHYMPIMGVRPTRVTYRALISRWGSCNCKTGEITISAYVLLLPQWCIEHVVVHEMCHLLVPNHGPEFHALMDKFFPRWREARKETARICRMEEE